MKELHSDPKVDQGHHGITLKNQNGYAIMNMNIVLIMDFENSEICKKFVKNNKIDTYIHLTF